MYLAAQVFAHLSGQRVYLPVCFACHSASILRMFASSIVWYHLAPLRSVLVPVTCPCFILCSFLCVVGKNMTLCSVLRSPLPGGHRPCAVVVSALSPAFSLAQRHRHVVIRVYIQTDV